MSHIVNSIFAKITQKFGEMLEMIGIDLCECKKKFP